MNGISIQGQPFDYGSMENIIKKKNICNLVKECTQKNNDHFADSKYICRIHVHCRIFDWSQPPNRSRSSAGTGTGFIIRGLDKHSNDMFIVTAYHVVENAIQIRSLFSGASQYVDTPLVGANPAMDVALLQLKFDDFNTIFESESISKVGIECGNSDGLHPLAHVTAHGFALGKPHIQMTAGVISGRISDPARLQIDVAVNPGNSGGPLLNDLHQVIGIVVSGMTKAQGINYAAPIFECLIICKRIIKEWKPNLKIHDNIPALNASFTKANETIMKHFHCSSGVICTSVHPHTEKNNLYRGLVICAVGVKCPACREDNCVEIDTQYTEEKFEIDLQMTCEFPFWPERLPFHAVLDRLAVDDQIKMYYHQKEENEREQNNPTDITKEKLSDFKRILHSSKNVYRTLYSEFDDAEYYVIGGVWLMELRHNHIPLLLQKKIDLTNFMTSPSQPHQSLIIVTSILPESEFNKSDTIGAGDILEHINSTEINSMDDIKNACENTLNIPSGIISLHMRDGMFASATVKDIKESEIVIAKAYTDEYIGYHGHKVSTSKKRQELP